MRSLHRHNCTLRHDNVHEFVSCATRSDQVFGSGAFALVLACGAMPVVEVFQNAEQSTAARDLLNRGGCGPHCRGRHSHYCVHVVVSFDDDGPEDPRPGSGSTPNSEHDGESTNDAGGDVGARGHLLHRRPGRLLGGMGVNILISRGFVDPSFSFREKYQLALGVVKSASEQAKRVCVNLKKTLNACAWVGFSLGQAGKA